MKKYAALLVATALVSGCINNHKTVIGAEQLQHHRFVLTHVNGQPLNSGEEAPELSFGEHMSIYGQMCNQFRGNGKISNGELKVEDLAMTHMLCPDAKLNKLDVTLTSMLQQGAQVDLTAGQLTLTTANQTLIYKLADRMN
ncbi:heat shock protein HslJ [Enterobacteriaceae bacterium ESL0689]|nr:heat shock protein HslJ [Enterobacteriaceae bacterium ESL0689]